MGELEWKEYWIGKMNRELSCQFTSYLSILIDSTPNLHLELGQNLRSGVRHRMAGLFVILVEVEFNSFELLINNKSRVDARSRVRAKCK